MQIAVCDDEKEIRDMLAKKIRRLYPEADLLLYRSGEELLMSAGEPDILLLDIQMPGKNGMEAAKELRRKNKKAIIIFVTAFDGFVFQAFDVGAFHYLVKPFNDRKFAEVLQNAVKQYGDRKKLEDAGGKGELPSLMITATGQHIAVKPEEIVKELFMLTVPSITGMTGYGIMIQYQTSSGMSWMTPIYGLYNGLAFLHFGISIVTIVVVIVLFQNIRARQEEKLRNELLAIQVNSIEKRSVHRIPLQSVKFDPEKSIKED